MKTTSALELRARLALLGAPDRVLGETALGKAIGSPRKAARDELVKSLEETKAATVEAARRGRRVRLAATSLGLVRVPPRGRFSGKVVNQLLERIAQLEGTNSTGEATSAPGIAIPERRGARESVLAAHARLARGPGGTADLASLREALPDLERPAVDAALRDLDREGLVSLGKAVDLGALEPRLRDAAIDDPLRGCLVYVSRAVTS